MRFSEVEMKRIIDKGFDNITLEGQNGILLWRDTFGILWVSRQSKQPEYVGEYFHGCFTEIMKGL